MVVAGISILKAARVIPGLGGLVDDAARWLGNAVADIAGMFSETLKRLIRSRIQDAGLAIFEAAEEKAEDKGKQITEDEFKETRDAQGAAFIEDSAAVIFRDMLFNEERDFAGTETDRLNDSVEKLVEAASDSINLLSGAEDSKI